jgi:hypothetical protein
LISDIALLLHIYCTTRALPLCRAASRGRGEGQTFTAQKDYWLVKPELRTNIFK